MGLYSKLDVERDNNYMSFNVTTMRKFGYTGQVELLPSDYSDDGRTMARAHVLGPFHVDLAAVGDKYFCFVALGADGQWSDLKERNVYELNCSTVWTGANKIAKAFIRTIEEVRVIAEAYFQQFPEDHTESFEQYEIENEDEEEFDWEAYSHMTPVKSVLSGERDDIATEVEEVEEVEDELISEKEALRMIDEALGDVLEDIFSLSNFKELVAGIEEIFESREIDIHLKIGNKNLGAMFPESTVKLTAKGVEEAIFFADRAHWAYFDPDREGKPYKTTQIGLLEGAELIALFMAYFFLMKATLSLATDEGRKAAENNNLSLGLMVPILNYFRAIKAEENQTSSLAASAYLDGWQEIVDKFS